MTNKEKALEIHKQWNGKLSVEAKCQVASAEDLAIAYTPGVAEPCRAIAKDPKEAYTYTIKSNTVAVVSDGSAVLGLGNIGALAAMPVMEGKAALFKDLAVLMPSLSVLIHRIQKKLLKLLSESPLLLVALT